MTGKRATLTWYGQAGFRLAAGGDVVLIDLFVSERDSRRYPPVADAKDVAGATLVLCTHEHIDHMDTGFLKQFCEHNQAAPIVVPAPATDIAVQAGLDKNRLTGAEPGKERTFGHVVVHPVTALHGVGGGQPVAYEFLDGRFLGYGIDIGGIRFFHAGDGLVYPELAPALKNLAPDVLMLPINGRDHMRESAGLVGNMNEAEAAWLAAEVNPAYVIPMHYEMFTTNRGDVGRFAALVHDQSADAGPAILIPPRARPVTIVI
jgi:L-ascorbate 6-phosphate lactonase